MGVEALRPPVLEAVCRVLADTSTGLTNSEIGDLLHRCGIDDPTPTNTKWRRLLDALGTRQNRDGVATNVLGFVQQAMDPARYVGRSKQFSNRQASLNAVLALQGLRISDEGKVETAPKAKTAREAEERAGRLRVELLRRDVHPEVLKACRSELLEQNYFHAVLEAAKSVAEKLRDLSGLELDGAELVDEAFSRQDRDRRPQTPLLAINTLRSISEQSEHRGLMFLMKGVFAVFRNPTAHELKARWAVDKRDALDLLTLVSIIHRRLETATRTGARR